MQGSDALRCRVQQQQPHRDEREQDGEAARETHRRRCASPSGRQNEAVSAPATATTAAVLHTTCPCHAYTTTPAIADSPMTASDVPWAWCWVAPNRRVSNGIRTMPPPTPKRPPASPAPTLPEWPGGDRLRAFRLVGLRCARGGGSALDQTDHVGEAGRRGRRAEHHRDHVAALGVDQVARQYPASEMNPVLPARMS